jgi:hypothetical protein
MYQNINANTLEVSDIALGSDTDVDALLASFAPAELALV